MSTQPAADGKPEPASFGKMGERVWRAWLVVVALVIVGLWFLMFRYHAGPRHAAAAAPSARAHAVAHHKATHHGRGRPAAAPGVVRARALTPASAAAFGPRGAGRGDHGGLAHFAIDARLATAWHTDWYATAHFGGLYPGTGLLVDMGRPVTVTAARIRLGRVHGAGLQIRVGASPVLGALTLAARRADAGGVVRLRLTSPAHGRYVLIWFTSLPPDRAGTFQARVYNLWLAGRP